MRPGPKPKMRLRLEQAGTLEVAGLIAEALTYREIARRFGVSTATLLAWIEADSERSHVCARAREASAQIFEERAEEEIRSAQDPFSLAKARELAIHLRWRAKALNPRRYGDKMAVDSTVSVQEMTDEQLIAALLKFGISVPPLSSPSAPLLIDENISRIDDANQRPLRE